MIIGIGVDTVNLERFVQHLERTPLLRERLFSPSELRGGNAVADDHLQETSDAMGAGLRAMRADRPLRPEQLAARFAAKEALVKALGGGIPGFAFRDVTVVKDAHGAPHFELSGPIAEYVKTRGVRLHLSMSHDAPVAQAFVVVETLG